ncbi:DUF4265 domain-containing protein [Streptomyces xanthophaeus]|uniref:DUF4265 domain-containing protein n=1 Tax=Streptomyces xanthophaeus TaxID=67385 RepID=UPI00068FA8DE|nr:DUF4265 domain-containing protein [Streptomyces xanthophaeus]
MDLGDGTVRLDHTPWFVRGLASDDTIRVEVDDEGVRWAGETVRASENCTIRLIVLKVPPTANLPKIRKLLEHGDVKGWWHWEEGCVTAAWKSTASE